MHTAGRGSLPTSPPASCEVAYVNVVLQLTGKSRIGQSTVPPFDGIMKNSFSVRDILHQRKTHQCCLTSEFLLHSGTCVLINTFLDATNNMAQTSTRIWDKPFAMLTSTMQKQSY